MNTKRFAHGMIFALLVFALLSAAFNPIIVARAASTDEGSVAVSLLNLRKGPGFDYDVIKVLGSGQKLSILKTSSDGLWLNVKLPDSTEGWVYRAYVKLASTIDSANGTVLVDALNLRVGPGTGYRILATLKKGQAVSISGRSLYSEWLVVKTKDGTQGWVFSPYIETKAEIGSLPVSEAYGGPGSSGNPGTPLSVLVTIRDNQAVVDLHGFPKNADVSVKLVQSGSSWNPASGTTNDSGSAQINFEMPKGAASGTLKMVVSTEDGSFSRTATIVYYK